MATNMSDNPHHIHNSAAQPQPRSFAPGVYVDREQLLQLRFAAQSVSLFNHRPAASALAGGYRTKARGRGIDFEEVRPYHPGDDIRSIDWRVTARTQLPHTKVFREERERPVVIITDQRPPMFFGSHSALKSVVAAQLSACLAWSALSSSDRIGSLVFGAENQADLRPKRSKNTVLSHIKHLTEYNQRLHSPVENYSNTLTAMLEETRRIARPGCALFIISDFHDFTSEAQQQLHLLARHADLTLIHVHDPLEQALPQAGQLTVTNSRQKAHINTHHDKSRQAYQQSFISLQVRLAAAAQGVKSPLLNLSTTDSPSEWLHKVYNPKYRATQQGDTV